MLRFILETSTRDMGHVRTELHTITADCLNLESSLQDHRGGGPDDDDFVYTKVIGVEVAK